MATDKPVHTVVLDTGAIIKNEPPVSTLLKQAETIVTVPAIISEIRDATTRLRVQTTLQPFLAIRSPSPSSIKFVTDFARKTGDLAVLSKPDIQIIALTYEIECERNNGDWRLRKVPGQKGLNGPQPEKPAPETADQASNAQESMPEAGTKEIEPEPASSNETLEETSDTNLDDVFQVTAQLESTNLSAGPGHPLEDSTAKVDSAANSIGSQDDADSDSDGWITPSNLKKKQAEDAAHSAVQTPEPVRMEVGVLTSDFAMQNVILQMNLNLLSSSMSRIKHLKTFVLRCHACFNVSKDLTKQFCPRCGQPSLTKVACSTTANGQFVLHLKKNYQFNTRGDRYSIPKPVHGSANGKISGGGKGGWGNELILAEDQKEYQSAQRVEKRHKEKSLMDEDYLPSIITGDRAKSGGRVKVGAGRNVNSRKR